ncbi:MAG TPA: hypothetical protein VMV10_05400 [Pirellulales bacterium]|nr:hypothetical protein [Pirellulales bacterium]
MSAMNHQLKLVANRSTDGRSSGDGRQLQPRSCHSAVCSALVLFIATCFASPAAAADQKGAVSNIRVGFAGQYRVGCWTPVEVELQGGESDLQGCVELTAPDGDGLASVVTSDELTLPAGQTSRELMYVKFGRLESPLKAAFRANGEIAFSRAFVAGAEASPLSRALPSAERLIVQLGSPIGIEAVLAQQRRDSPDHAALAVVSQASELPARWFGYESADTVVLSADDQLYADFQRDPQRVRALEEWLEKGGRLIFAPGASALRSLQPDSLVARLAPGTFEGLVSLQRTGSLETYTGSAVRIELRRSGGLQIARLSDWKGAAEVREGDLPLVVRSPRGFGRVTFIALNLGQGPLAAWPGRTEFVKRLLGGHFRREHQDEQHLGRGPATHLGLTDLAGQLRGALDQYAEVELAPFWLVAGLIVVYLLLIGPIDFFLHRRLTRRMGLTWLTFPFWVLLFSAGAYWGAGRLKGDTLRVNQVDLVDFDVASQRVRGTTWLNVFSPETRLYDLSLAPRLPAVDPAEPTETLWSWMGMPGPVLGGMEQTAAFSANTLQAYRFSPALDETSGTPIPVWSTKGFTARWQCQASPRLESRLTAGIDGMAAGRITSRLGAPLTDCLLISGRWAYKIGELAPGQTVVVRPGEQRDLQAVLKDFKMVKEEKNLVQISTPYNQAGFDIRSILQQMTFYDAAGGRRYTGLANRYQEFVDLSDHLELGQAILWGVTSERPTELENEGKPLAGASQRHWTFYRFVLPLESKSS